MQHSSASGASHSENPDGGDEREERRGEGPAAMTRMPRRAVQGVTEVYGPPGGAQCKERAPLSVSGARAKEMPTNPLS